MQDIRYIDFEAATNTLKVDKKQYINMLISFDKLTLDDSISSIHLHILHNAFNKAGSEANNLNSCAKTIQTIGLSTHVSDLLSELKQIFKNQKQQDIAIFYALIQLDKFITNVLSFKQEIKRISNQPQLNNSTIATRIQQDVRISIHEYNISQKNLTNSGMQTEDLSQINKYINHSQIVSPLNQSRSILQDQLSYSRDPYFVSRLKLNDTFNGQKVQQDQQQQYQTNGQYRIYEGYDDYQQRMQQESLAQQDQSIDPYQDIVYGQQQQYQINQQPQLQQQYQQVYQDENDQQNQDAEMQRQLYLQQMQYQNEFDQIHGQQEQEQYYDQENIERPKEEIKNRDSDEANIIDSCQCNIF